MNVVYFLFLISCGIQIVFYLIIFTRFLRFKTTISSLNKEDYQAVSVVVCAKNEFENLSNNLDILLRQNYSEYEVIVVDDGSKDGTSDLLQEFEKKYANFFSFRLAPEEKLHAGKKQALSYGISLAKHKLVVVTDADCIPASNNWVRDMVTPLHHSADIVLGISPYTTQKGFLNSFFRMEALSVAKQYLNFTLAGLPFMGVGRNMAYKKEIFESYDIYQHWDLVSGDDDLFINDKASNHKIEIVATKDAYTYSAPPSSFQQWFRQKLRHYSTGYYYHLMQKIWLGYYWTTSLLLYIFLGIVGVNLLLGNPSNRFNLLIVSITLLTRWTITLLTINKLGEKKLNWFIPLLDFFYILSVWLVSPLSRVAKIKWK